VHLFDMLFAILSGKVRDFFSVWSVVTLLLFPLMLFYIAH